MKTARYLGTTLAALALVACASAGAGQAATLTVNAIAGKTYSLLYRNDLTTGAWQKLRDVSGTGAVIITDPSPSPGHRYYRIVTPAQP